MPEIIITNLKGKRIPAKEGVPLLQLIQESGTDWMHACGAKGRCTTCAMQVEAGGENLSPYSEAELNYRESGRLGKSERLACQCTAHGDVKIRVPARYQFPHLDYSTT